MLDDVLANGWGKVVLIQLACDLTQFARKKIVIDRTCGCSDGRLERLDLRREKTEVWNLPARRG